MTVSDTVIIKDTSLTKVEQGTDLKVDGGLTSAYVTPLGEPALPPPSSLTV